MKEGFSKDFYRKGNSVKRSGPFSEPRDCSYFSCSGLRLPQTQERTKQPAEAVKLDTDTFDH